MGCVGTVACVVLLAGRVEAQTIATARPVSVILVDIRKDAASSQIRAETLEALANALGSDGIRLASSNLAAAELGRIETERAIKAQAARQTAAQAREAFLYGDYDLAEALFASSIDGMEKAWPALPLRELAATELALGRVLLAKHREKSIAARVAFKRALVAVPELVPEAQELSPAEHLEFEKARRDARIGRLAVGAVAPGATRVTISVDERAASASLEGVSEGEHFVAVEALGFFPWHGRVRVEEQAVAALEAVLQPLPHTCARLHVEAQDFDGLWSCFPPTLRAERERAYLLLLRDGSSTACELPALAFAPNAARPIVSVCLAGLEGQEPSLNAASNLLELISPPARGQLPIHPPPPAPSWYTSWWLFTGVGASVVAGIAVGFALSTPEVHVAVQP